MKDAVGLVLYSAVLVVCMAAFLFFMPQRGSEASAKSSPNVSEIATECPVNIMESNGRLGRVRHDLPNESANSQEANLRIRVTFSESG